MVVCVEIQVELDDGEDMKIFHPAPPTKKKRKTPPLQRKLNYSIDDSVKKKDSPKSLLQSFYVSFGMIFFWNIL